MGIGKSKPVIFLKKKVIDLFYSPVGRILPDKFYLECMYFFRLKKKLNLKAPVTFNEKTQWLKLYNRRPEYTKMVDKYEVKDYVAEKIGDEYIIRTLGVWDSFDEIDFSALPEQFVLKCTHDSGGLVICKDKKSLNMSEAKEKLEKSLKYNFYWAGREWPYKNVKPRIIAEEYMEDPETEELRDYKFFCFNGVPRLMFIASDRQNPDEDTKFDFFDMDFNHLPFMHGHPNATKEIACPRSFDLMKELSAKLSIDIPFVRVDFYEIEGKVYFGELTFFHHNGTVAFDPEEWDKTLGDMINLDGIKEEK